MRTSGVSGRLDEQDANFVYLWQTDETRGTQRVRTKYAYSADDQNGTQYGNLTEVWEYDVHDASAEPTAWLRHTRRWYRPGSNASHYVVNRVALENVFAFDPSNLTGDGTWDRSTWYCYDGAGYFNTVIGSGQNGDDGTYRGRLTAVRRNVDGASLADVTYGYDAYGNRTGVTEWNSYGTFGTLANVDGRTTTFGCLEHLAISADSRSGGS